MKSTYKGVRKIVEDTRGVFGLTSVQQFFAIILGVALLAYVIVVIMGTLSSSTILPASSLSTTVVNETGFINVTGDTLGAATVPGFSSPAIVTILNATSNLTIAAGNYTLSASGVLTNASAVQWSTVRITYTYSYNSQTVNNANTILTNTSSGISGFFSGVQPVYAILAILVIILVLVVLVRVVSGRTEGGSSAGSPQL